jgi:dienelactone hydrolase
VSTVTSARVFDFDSYVRDLDQDHVPALAYQPGADFREWHGRLRAKVRSLLGPLPESTPPDPEVIETEAFDRYVQHKVVYRSAAAADIPAYLLIPTGVDAASPAPAVLALHGHGEGKEQLVASDAEDNIYSSFARRYAERGFVVLAPDAIGFGERAADFRRYGARDGCNINFLKTSLFGINLMALNIWDDMRGLDYLASRPEVDAARIGCAGLSFGGTRTMYLAALDDRVRAAVVSGYLTSFRAYALEPGNFCGSQFLPGIYAHADVADLHGLIAPRPLLIEAGLADRGFPIEASRAAHAQLEQIYAAAGASERLERDEFEGGHAFHAVASLDFMQRRLQPEVKTG